MTSCGLPLWRPRPAGGEGRAQVHARHEGARRCIAFRDLLGKDFRSYVGEWRLAADSMGTQVEYELEAEPRAALPRALCRGTLHRSAQALLEQVRAEMLRRGAQAAEPDSGLGRR